MNKLSALVVAGLLSCGCVSAGAQSMDKFLPSRVGGGHAYGHSVSMSGTVAIVGAPSHGAYGSAAILDLATKQEVHLLEVPEGSGYTWFGSSVSVSGTIAVVGSWGQEIIGYQSGAAYVYDTGTGVQTHRLLAADGVSSDFFGTAVAISGNVVLVGAPGDDDNGSYSGSAYLFDATTGQQLHKLLPADGVASDGFGSVVSIDGTTAVVSSTGSDALGSGSGAVYVFDVTTGVQTRKLVPDDGGAGDAFGRSVAVRNGVVAVGADGHDENGTDAGAAYAFDASTGVQLKRLLPIQSGADDLFGFSVAVENGTVVVGAVQDNGFHNEAGTAFVFDLNTGDQVVRLVAPHGWYRSYFGSSVSLSGGELLVGVRHDNEQATEAGAAFLVDLSTLEPGSDIPTNRILAAEGEAGDFMGSSVAVSGTTGIAGSHGYGNSGKGPGSAYLFDTATRQQLFRLIASDGEQYGRFGKSVAINESYAIVGAPYSDYRSTDTGTVYVFDTSTGQELRKLNASDYRQYDHFGEVVAISGDLCVIGAPDDDEAGNNYSGSAYVFNVSTGQQLFKLLPSDGQGNKHFGDAVAIEGTTVVVGARHHDGVGINSGAVYVFDANTGLEIAKIVPDDTAYSDSFGFSVGISGGTIIVGATGNDDLGSNSGSAYLFDLDTQSQLFKLLPDEGAKEDYFGLSVAISGGIACVGANRSDQAGIDSGVCYLFDVVTGEQLSSLTPVGGEYKDEFGAAVAIDGEVVLVGCPLDDDAGEDAGSVFVFDVPEAGCPADLNGDDFVDVGDISLFITLFLDGDSAADLNADGFIDVGDIGLFVTLFLAGC